MALPVLWLALVLGAGTAAAQSAPSLEQLLRAPDLLADPLALLLVKGRTSTVFRGQQNSAGFNLHSYLAHHDGKFWAIWSSSGVGEEDPDQHVRYATSADGHNWSPAASLVADPDGPRGPARWIARGVYRHGGKLTALAAYIESADYGKRGQQAVWKGLRLMRFEWDGKAWRDQGVMANDCMNNFPPERLGDSEALVCRDQNMDVFMALRRGPREAWTRTPLAAAPPNDRMDEPTFYATQGGEVHMLIRDNNKSGYLLRALSRDAGKTWTAPVRTNYPDATSKNFPGRLSNGWFFLINNPNPRKRDPLAISFSRDGWQFEKPLAIRKGAPERRFAGRAKGSGSLQYPHAIEHGGSLWVIYSTNKEDIEVTEIPLAPLGLSR
jgi:predicted neuraminidase